MMMVNQSAPTVLVVLEDVRFVGVLLVSSEVDLCVISFNRRSPTARGDEEQQILIRSHQHTEYDVVLFL